MRPTNGQPTTGRSTDRTALLEMVEVLRQQLAEEREANKKYRHIIADLVQRVSELEPAPEPREAPETTSGNGCDD
jgi:hypothetical protein